MKKSLFSLAVVTLLSASCLSASAQPATSGQNTVGGTNPRPQTVGGTNPRPQTVGGTNPRPQGLLGGIYTTVMHLFGL